MHVAALSNDGRIDREVLKMPHVAPIFAPLSANQALASIDRWYVASAEQLRASGRAEETLGLEKWGLSPLVAKPIVAFPDGSYVIPWARLLLDRISPTGLYFIGTDHFGGSFPDSLGTMFEKYVGTQLRLLNHVRVNGEVVYGKSSERTVDYFLITEEVIVLVEVKSARPVRATRLGEPLGDIDTAKKLNHAYHQIDHSAQMIRNRHSAMAALPSDRPIRGVIVTMEPFYLVNTPLYDEVLTRPSTPTTVVSAHELEGDVAVLQNAPDAGARLLNALTPVDGEIAKLGDATAGLSIVGNPILQSCWDRFTAPWSSN
jgi:hypothetical protein